VLLLRRDSAPYRTSDEARRRHLEAGEAAATKSACQQDPLDQDPYPATKYGLALDPTPRTDQDSRASRLYPVRVGRHGALASDRFPGAAAFDRLTNGTEGGAPADSIPSGFLCRTATLRTRLPSLSHSIRTKSPPRTSSNPCSAYDLRGRATQAKGPRACLSRTRLAAALTRSSKRHPRRLGRSQ
jgi:hypothetical protein